MTTQTTPTTRQQLHRSHFAGNHQAMNFAPAGCLACALDVRVCPCCGELQGLPSDVATFRDAEPVRRSAAPAPAAPVSVSAEPVKDGTYTVVLDGGARRTIRIRSHAEEAGLQFVSLLSGSDNEHDYQCVGLLRDGRYSWTRRYAENATKSTELAQAVRFLLAATTERRECFGRAYALESGNCYVCGRTLTDPESIELGIGPTCRGKR